MYKLAMWIVAMATAAGLGGRALAQDTWPTKPVRVIIPCPPGASGDVTGRVVVAQLAQQLGQPFIVENRPGANGTIGQAIVAKAEPDGHTILIASSSWTAADPAAPGACARGGRGAGQVYLPELATNPGYAEFMEALGSVPLRANARWIEQTVAARADYVEWPLPRRMPGPVQYGEIVHWLSDQLPADAVLTTGAGNFTAWVHRHFACTRSRTLLGPTNGSMGYS